MIDTELYAAKKLYPFQEKTVNEILGELEANDKDFNLLEEDKLEEEYKDTIVSILDKIKSKKISIYEFELTRVELPEIDFRIRCSKGTYIRSIARDFGLALDNGAHLTALRRTKIGEFKVEDAISPGEFKLLCQEE